MIGVGAHAVANNFGDDLRATLLGELQFFQDQDARAFADDEAVAVLVPGTAGVMRIVVARGQRAHGGKSADAHGSDGGFGAAGNHHVGVAVLDDARGIANGMRAGGAGGAGGLVRALGVMADADLAGGEIDDGRGNEERRDLARAAVEQVVVLALDDVESADAGADVDAGALGHFFVFDFVVGHAQGFIAGGDGQMNKARHLARFLLLDDLQRIEVLDLGGNPAGKGGGVEAGDLLHAALARQQCLPHRVGIIADGADEPDPGYHHAPAQTISILSRGS